MATNNTRVVASDIRSGLPAALYWDADHMAAWVEDIGFPQYRGCFERNFITGRRLIAVDASTLPDMGVHDFEDIKEISRLIRELLQIPSFPTNRNLRMRDPKIAYMEMKRRSGMEMDNTTYTSFLFDHKHFFPQIRRRSLGRRSSRSRSMSR